MTRVVRSEDRMVVTSPLKIKTRSRKPIKRDWDTDIEIERGGPSSSLVFRNLPEGETLEEFGAAGDGGGGWIRNQEINVHRFSEFLKARWSTYTLRCLHLLVAPQDISEPYFPMCALALAFVIILSLLCSIHVCSIKHVALEFASHNPSTRRLKTHQTRDTRGTPNRSRCQPSQGRFKKKWCCAKVCLSQCPTQGVS